MVKMTFTAADENFNYCWKSYTNIGFKHMLLCQSNTTKWIFIRIIHLNLAIKISSCEINWHKTISKVFN